MDHHHYPVFHVHELTQCNESVLYTVTTGHHPYNSMRENKPAGPVAPSTSTFALYHLQGHV